MTKFWHYGLSKADYDKCIPAIKSDAWRMDRILCYFAFFVFLCLFGVSLIFSKLGVFTWIYLSFDGVFAILSAYFMFFKRNDEAAIPAFYLISAALFAFGMALSFVYPSGKSTIIHILIVVLPFLFTDKAIRTWAYSIFITLIYVILTFFFKDSSIRFEECFNAISVTAVSLAGHWILGKIRCKGYLAICNNQEMIGKLNAVQEELKKRDGYRRFNRPL